MSATVDLTREQERTLQILDFDPDLPCEIKDKVTLQLDCGERASWVIRCKHCRGSFLVCFGHKAEIIAAALRSEKVGCPACKRWTRRLDDLVDILPLRSAL